MIYSACELLPTCNKLENPGVRKSHYSASDRSWRTWKVTPHYGLHIISLWTLLGHIRIYHCALQIEHKRTTQKTAWKMIRCRWNLHPSTVIIYHLRVLHWSLLDMNLQCFSLGAMLIRTLSPGLAGIFDCHHFVQWKHGRIDCQGILGSDKGGTP